jgi:hypothetical protein
VASSFRTGRQHQNYPHNNNNQNGKRLQHKDSDQLSILKMLKGISSIALLSNNPSAANMMPI